MTRLLPVLAAAGVCAALPAVGAGAPEVRITSMRVVMPDGVTPARPPYLRTKRYAYRVEYRVEAGETMRVRRTATVFSPFGDLVARVRPGAGAADPGAYFASAPIAVRPGDPPGAYTVRYTVRATDSTGSTTRQRVLSLRFR